MTPRETLRRLRLKNGLTVREVEAASRVIAENYGNPRFVIVPSRLSDLETHDKVPTLFCFHSLSLIYGCSASRLYSLFGVDPKKVKATSRRVRQFVEGSVQSRLAQKRQRVLAREQKRQHVLQRRAERKKRLALVIRLWRQGLTYAAVARRTGLTVTQVNYALICAGRAGLRTPRAPRARRPSRADNP